MFADLAAGKTRQYVDRLADHVRITVPGTGRWAGTYEGKQVAMDRLFRPLFARFADRFTNTAHRFIAEGDLVVVESRGRVMTTAGEPYNNVYCQIFQLADGKITAVDEYCDTALIEAVLRG